MTELQLNHCTVGDSLAILPMLADGSFDAVVSDRPYGVKIDTWDDSALNHLLPEYLRIARGVVVLIGPRRGSIRSGGLQSETGARSDMGARNDSIAHGSEEDPLPLPSDLIAGASRISMRDPRKTCYVIRRWGTTRGIIHARNRLT